MSASLGFGVVLQQRVRREQHAWRAESALQAVLIPEALLQRVQRCRRCAKPSTVRISWPSACAANIVHDFTARVAVHDDDAAAAARRVAADVRAGQTALFAEEVREQRARLDVPLVARRR